MVEEGNVLLAVRGTKVNAVLEGRPVVVCICQRDLVADREDEVLTMFVEDVGCRGNLPCPWGSIAGLVRYNARHLW